MRSLRTYVYVDGFNLYYRALKGTPFKWINLKMLCDLSLGSGFNVAKIRYFTARVSANTDPDQPRRQQLYLKALGTIPEIEVHYGKFLVHPARMPLQTVL